MKKITELEETKLRTIHVRNEYGELERDAEEWVYTRPVKTVSPGKRILHYFIDSICFQLIVGAIALLMESVGVMASEYNANIFTLISLFSFPSILTMYILFYAGFEFLFQKTPAKFITGCSVIDEYGQKPELKSIILRTLIRLVPFEPFSCTGDKYSYGWHDKWSKTWVVTDDELFQIHMLQLKAEDESVKVCS